MVLWQGTTLLESVMTTLA